jgi:hypothetical protein
MPPGNLDFVNENIAPHLSTDKHLVYLQGIHLPGSWTGFHNELVCHVFLLLLFQGCESGMD